MKTKIFLTIAFCLLPFALFSQAPQGFNYQAVARAGDNAILANITLDVKIGLLQGNATGTLVWEETHSVTTNDLGLFTLKIGDTNATGGTGSAASFADIDWTLGSFYMKVQINDGGGYVDLGSSELLSVPYALFAETGNEGLQGPIGLTGPQGLAGIGLNNHGSWSADSSYYEGDYVFAKSTGDPAINSMWILQGTSPFTSSTEPRLDTDNWIEFEAPQGPPGDPATDDQTLSIDGHELTISGGNMVTLPDNVIDDDADPFNEIQDLQLTDNDLIITNNASATTIDLSPYLDNWILNGDSVYYMGSVGVGTSTPQGKMAVQGDDVTSEDPLFEVKRKDGQTVFAVYNEGVRVYVDTAEAKGPKGGFAVGGFSASKDAPQEYLRVTPDSVRVYIDETISKGPKGGFAVGGFSPGKAVATDLMSLTKENYFIGHSSGSNITTGTYNSFFGYQSGYNNTIGHNNSFIGPNSGFYNTTGSNNSFLGYYSGMGNKTGLNNTYIGYRAGYSGGLGSDASGSDNVFIGVNAGESNTTGHDNIGIGNLAGNSNTGGLYNAFIGTNAGMSNLTGDYNTFLGYQAGYTLELSSYNTCIGYKTGYAFTFCTGTDSYRL